MSTVILGASSHCCNYRVGSCSGAERSYARCLPQSTVNRRRNKAFTVQVGDTATLFLVTAADLAYLCGNYKSSSARQLSKAVPQRAHWASAAKVEDEVESPVDDLEDEVAEPSEPTAPAPDAPQPSESSTEDIDFSLNFLWMEKNIAVAVDQVFAKNQRSPVTEYFFWPRRDAWEELKIALETKPWISARDKVLLLNRTTEVINFWQTEGNKPSLDQAQQAFPDCIFKGS